MNILRRARCASWARCPHVAAGPSYAGLETLASEVCEAGRSARRLIEREDDFVGIAGRQFYTGAFIEVVEIERIGLQAAGARFEVRVRLAHLGEAAFERMFAGLQVDVGQEALMPRDR